MKKLIIGIVIVVILMILFIRVSKSQTTTIQSPTGYFQQLNKDEKALFYGSLHDFLTTEYHIPNLIFEDAKIDVHRIANDTLIETGEPLSFMVKGVGTFLTNDKPHKFVYIVNLTNTAYLPIHFDSSYAVKSFNQPVKNQAFDHSRLR